MRPTVGEGRRAVQSDRWDAEAYDAQMASFADFAANGRALAEVAPETGPDLWADLFAAFHRMSVTLVPAIEMDPDFAVNHQVMAAVTETPAYERLKLWTAGDPVASTTAAITLRPTLERIYDRTALARRMAEDFAAKAAELLASEEDEETTEQLLAEVKESAALLAAREQQDDAVVATMVIAGLGAAVARAETESARAAMWGVGHSQLLRLPAKKRLELARRMRDPRWEELADLVGALERLMSAQTRVQVSDTPDEVYDVTVGGNLDRVLLTSKAQLFDPVRGPAHWAQYLDGTLPSYALRAAEKAGRGGVVLCMDNSSSMRDPPRKELFAKAVGLVLLNRARQQNRAFHGVHFSSGAWGGKPAQLMEFDFTGEFPAERVLDFAEFFFGGGTDFVPPLDLALARLTAEYERTGATDADIVFVTDGECAVSARYEEDFLAEMDRIGAVMWGILVDDRWDTGTLARLCRDRVATVEDIRDPTKDLGDIFGGLARA